jgi:hypothetical protein
VRYSFLAMPKDCRPRAMSVIANPVHEPEQITTPVEGASVRAGQRGTIVIPLRPGERGPYEVRLSSISGPEAVSAVTTIAVRE